MERTSPPASGRGRFTRRLACRSALVALPALLLVVAPVGAEPPVYQWQFAEWREVSVLGNLAAKLVREPRHDQIGGFVRQDWDLLGPSFVGGPAFLHAVAHDDGRVFWAKAVSPLRGGVAGNTIGGKSLVMVIKDYVKTSEASLLRFVYSAGKLELVNYGTGRDPWLGPSAKIEMDVALLDFESRHRWGIRQSAHAHADLGGTIDDFADDTWQLDLSGEIRGEDAQTVETGARWRWICESCGTPGYGEHAAHLDAPYAEMVDLSDIPLYTGFTVFFALEVEALDRGQGETAARAFAKDPLSEDDLSAAGIEVEAAGVVEVPPAGCAGETGFAAAACLLDAGFPPASCGAGELPDAVLRPATRARTLLATALTEPSEKKRRGLAKRIRGSLRSADRALARREKAKRGAKPSVACGAASHAVLQRAHGRLASSTCDPAAGTVAFAATAYEVAEDGGSVEVALVRTGGSKGKLTAFVQPALDTATQGSDFTRPAARVTFANRDVGPRVVTIPILDDRIAEPDEDIVLDLTIAGGCAAGTPSRTTITIRDDEWLPAPPAFRVGGTVSGLEGSGLVLREHVSGQETSPANGDFAFAATFPAGSAYDVRVATQPTNPTQFCTVDNGSGVVGDADVTSIAVTCTTPSPGGALDPTFGDGGRRFDTWSSDVRALAQQADGKLLALGQRRLARYASDGTLDPTFGTGGIAEVTFGTGIDVEAQDVVVQPDGGILVAGHVAARFGATSDFALSRFAADGTLDTSFGTDGSVVTDFGGATDRAYQVLLQADGKIVLAGHAMPGGVAGGNDFAVARYDANGALDPSFGSGGKATANVAGATDLGRAAVLAPDGAIVVVGRVAPSGAADPDVGLVRFATDGTLDLAFGQDGVVRIDLSNGSWDEASAVALAPDGGLVVAVQALLGSTFDFVVARFDADGSLDGSFGDQGTVATAFGAGDDYVRALVVRDDGAIVVAGQASSATVSDFGLARYAADGTPDATFGDGGTLALDFFAAGDGAQCALLQADGKLVAAGSARNGATVGAALVRLAP